MAKIYDFGNKGKFKVLGDGSVQQLVNGQWKTLPGVEVRGNTVYVNGKRFGAVSGTGENVTYTAQGQVARGRTTLERVPPPPVEPGVQRGYTGPYMNVGGITVPEYTMRFKTPTRTRTLQPSEGLQLIGKRVQFPNGETFDIVPGNSPNVGIVIDANGNRVGELSVNVNGVLFTSADGQQRSWLGLNQNGPSITINGQTANFQVVGSAPNITASTPIPTPTPTPTPMPQQQPVTNFPFQQPTVLDFGDAGVFRVMPDGSVSQWDQNTRNWALLNGVTIGADGNVVQNNQLLGQYGLSGDQITFTSGDQTVTGRIVPFDQWTPPQNSGGSGSTPPQIGTGPEFANVNVPNGDGGNVLTPGSAPFPVSFGGLPLPGNVNAPYAAVGAAELAAQQGVMIPPSFVLGQSSGNPYAGIWGFLNGDAFAVTDDGNVFQWNPNTGLLEAMQGVKISPSGEVQTPQGVGQIGLLPSGEMVYSLNGVGNIGYRVG